MRFTTSAIQDLKACNIYLQDAFFDKQMQSYPDYPSLLSNKWNIPNGAGKIEPNQIGQLPLPFIAYTNDREYPLSIVTQVAETTIQVYSKNYSKAITKSKEEFLKNWTGIY